MFDIEFMNSNDKKKFTLLDLLSRFVVVFFSSINFLMVLYFM